MQGAVPIMSLAVAMLAVFVGPLVSWIIAKRTVQATQMATAWQLIVPAREKWLAELRERLAEMAGLSLHYYVAGFEDREDEEYRRLELLEQQIAFLLDVNNPLHESLLRAIGATVGAINRSGAEGGATFSAAHQHMTTLARRLVQAEWDRIVGGPGAGKVVSAA